MPLLLEALAAAAVAGPLVYGLVWLRRRRARWRPFYRSTNASAVRVELERAGSRAIDIASLDPHADDFSDRLAAARAEAAEKAAALNAARRG